MKQIIFKAKALGVQHVGEVVPDIWELVPFAIARPPIIRHTKDHHMMWPCHEPTSLRVHDTPSLAIIRNLMHCPGTH